MRYDDHGQALTTRTIVSDKYVVTSGSSVVHTLRAVGPANIAIDPASATSVSCSVLVAAGGTWRAAVDAKLSATITSATQAILTGPVCAVRFVSTGGSAVIEIAQ